MEQHTKSYMYDGKLYDCPITYSRIGILYPKDFYIYYMYKRDTNGNRIPFVVVDFYNSKGNFVESVPYFSRNFTSKVSSFIDCGKSLPSQYYLPQHFRYVEIQVPFEAYILYNYTDLKKNGLNMDYIYRPKRDNDGGFIKTNKILCLQKMFRRGTHFQGETTIDDLFYNYLDYCYDVIPGQKRRMFEYLQLHG